MSRKKILSTVAFALVCCGHLLADEQVISVDFAATVDRVTDPDNLLGGNVNVGDTIIGAITYALPPPPDTSPDPDKGHYSYTHPPTGVTACVGDICFEPLSEGRVSVRVWDRSSDGFNMLNIDSHPLPSGAYVAEVEFALGDSTGTLLEGTEPPKDFPLAGWDTAVFRGNGQLVRPPYSRYEFWTSITSLSICGNDVREAMEQCDGSDDAACPAQCLSDCVCRAPVPSVSGWGLAVLGLLLLVSGKVWIRQHRVGSRR